MSCINITQHKWLAVLRALAVNRRGVPYKGLKVFFNSY